MSANQPPEACGSAGYFCAGLTDAARFEVDNNVGWGVGDVMGGIRDGVDAVKALCLGADAVAFGTSAIIAGGCIACMQCHIGQCVTGIATQDPEHESRYDPEAESHNIHRFLEGVRWQIAALTHALGYSDFRALCRDDLVAFTPEAAEITGLSYEPGVRAKRPELRVQLG